MTEIAKIEATVIEIKRQWYDKLRISAVYTEADHSNLLMIDLPVELAKAIYINQTLSIVVTTGE